MVSVKNVIALDNLQCDIDDICQNIDSKICLSIKEIDCKLEDIERELVLSNSMLDITVANLIKCEAELTSAIASQNRIAIAMADVKLEKAQRNYIRMKQRVELVVQAKNAMSNFRILIQNEFKVKFNYIESQNNTLSIRLKNAQVALDSYLSQVSLSDAGIATDNYQYILHKYKKEEVSKKELEKAYIQKLNARKDRFRTSNYTQEENITYSEYNLPQFDSKFEFYIEPKHFNDSRNKHFLLANERLKEKIQNDEETRNLFDERELEQINSGITPDGYTWHHDGNPPPGRMQLVDSRIHDKIRHDGGYSLWIDRS